MTSQSHPSFFPFRSSSSSLISGGTATNLLDGIIQKIKTLYVPLKKGIEEFDCRQKRCKRRFKCLSQPVLNLWRNTGNHAGRLSLISLPPQFRPSSKCLLSPNVCHFWFKVALQHLLSITHLNAPSALSPYFSSGPRTRHLRCI